MSRYRTFQCLVQYVTCAPPEYKTEMLSIQLTWSECCDLFGILGCGQDLELQGYLCFVTRACNRVVDVCSQLFVRL